MRVLIFLGGALAFIDGRWARTHADAIPRYSAGLGSGFSPTGRRLWGTVVAIFGLVIMCSAVAGVPADFMH